MSKHGNRITDNAFTADSGENLIAKALRDIEEKTEWHISDKEKFAGAHGIYYDSKKIGSFFVGVENKTGTKAVLKLQLRPLPYDEGFITRFIGDQIKTNRLRLPKIYLDNRWNEEDGYGFVIFEDLSHLLNLWENIPPTQNDRENHKKFLKEFIQSMLPVKEFIEKPVEPYIEQLKESFNHHQTVAQHSNHKHINDEEVQQYEERYFKAVGMLEYSDLHFTHGHLTGLDVKVDTDANKYILLANLYWKWRPLYFEVAFPVWNDLMRIRNENLTLDEFLGILNAWNQLWRSDIYDHDPTSQKQYWAILLFFAMNTIMLDLGASEWKDDEIKEKGALLACWQEFFDWVIENKLK
jgi:hypothetical protein